MVLFSKVYLKFLQKKKHSGGLYPPCEKGQGDFILVTKKHGWDYIHLYKNDQGGFFPGGDFVRIPWYNSVYLIHIACAIINIT